MGEPAHAVVPRRPPHVARRPSPVLFQISQKERPRSIPRIDLLRGIVSLEGLRIHAAAERVAAAGEANRRILVDLRFGERRLQRSKGVDRLLILAEVHVAVIRRDVNENRDFQVLYMEDR